MLELKHKMFKNIRVKRNETYVIHEDGHKIVVVLCRVKATMNEVPPGYPGYPMFPGIEAEKLKGEENFLSNYLRFLERLLVIPARTPSKFLVIQYHRDILIVKFELILKTFVILIEL